MSKRFSLANVEANENFNRWNTYRIWYGMGVAELLGTYELPGCR